MLIAFVVLRSPKIHYQQAAFVTSEIFTFSAGYVYKKGERTLPGNLEGSKSVSRNNNYWQKQLN
jgi:hypothetical protein